MRNATVMFRFTIAVLFLQAGAAAQEFTVRTGKIPMRDGVKLATDIYLPSPAGKRPALVVRTPYDKSGERAYA